MTKETIYSNYAVFDDIGTFIGVKTVIYKRKILFFPIYHIGQFTSMRDDWVFCNERFHRFKRHEWYKAKNILKLIRQKTIMTTTELKKQYEDTVNRYLKAFCVKHNLNYDEAMNGWVANEVGGTVYISDYYIDFDDILRDINENIAERVFFDYYDYCMEAAHCGFTAPNYKSWLKGCPRLSKEQISAIKAAKQRADAAQHDLEKLIIDEQNAIGYKNPF